MDQDNNDKDKCNFTAGYVCPVCKGAGVIRFNVKCPRCNGEGFVPLANIKTLSDLAAPFLLKRGKKK